MLFRSELRRLIVYGTKTTGAESDIEQATQLARNMVTRWGMSDKLGMVAMAPRENPYLGALGGATRSPLVSEATAQMVDAEVQHIIDECHEQALSLLRANRKRLDGLVQALLQRETLNEQEILQATDLPAPSTPVERKVGVAPDQVAAAQRTN